MRHLFLFFGWVYACSTTGQNLQPALVFLPDNDTIEVFIDDRELEKSPDQITVWQDDSTYDPGTSTTYTPTQIRGFYLDRDVLYHAREITYDRSSIAINDLSYTPEADLVTDTAFVQVIIEGPLALYMLRRENRREHFFVGRSGEPLKELQNTHYLETDPQTLNRVRRERKEYINTLKTWMADCLAAHTAINESEFTLYWLKQIFLDYYEFCGGSDQIRYNAPRVRQMEIETSYTGGLAYTRLGIVEGTGITNGLRALDGETHTTYTVGMNISFLLSRQQHQFSFDSEILYRRQVFSYRSGIDSIFNSFTKQSTGEIAIDYLRWSPSFKHTFPGTFRPFYRFGLGLSFAANTRNLLTETRTSLPNGEIEVTHEPFVRESSFFPFEWSMLAGTGIRWNKLEAELRVERGNGFERYEGYNTHTTTLSMLLRYYFFRY